MKVKTGKIVITLELSADELDNLYDVIANSETGAEGEVYELWEWLDNNKGTFF